MEELLLLHVLELSLVHSWGGSGRGPAGGIEPPSPVAAGTADGADPLAAALY